MRIVIDMQGAQANSRNRGIGRYSMSLVQALLQNPGKHEFFLLLNGALGGDAADIRRFFRELLPATHMRIWMPSGSTGSLAYGNGFERVAAELIREACIVNLKPDIVLITSLLEGFSDDRVISIGQFPSNAPVAVIFYDLIPLLYPGEYLQDPVRRQWYETQLAFLRQADAHLAISASSRQESIDHLGMSPAKVFNILSAADDRFAPQVVPHADAASLRTRYKVSQPFVMYTGGSDVRKNIDGLIRAFALLPPELLASHQLVVVCALESVECERLTALAKKAGLRPGKLVLTGFVSETDLLAFYNLCKAFVFPSLHEGFGLPALEAMSCGKAVIAAHTSSMPEVIGCEDALFDPRDERAIATLLQRVLSDEIFRQRLEQHGLERAKYFSWARSGQLAMQALEACRANWQAQQDEFDVANVKTENTDVCAELLDKISALSRHYAPSDEQLRSLAWAIDRSVPEQPQQPPQMLVDISVLAQWDAQTGIQRVVRAILWQWLRHPPSGYRVEPIYATSRSAGFRYARAFTAHFLGRPEADVADEPISYTAGDQFVGLDLCTTILPMQKTAVEAMHVAGVQMQFVIYDLLPVMFPRYFLKEVTDTHKDWLDTILAFDGVLCISRSVADDLRAWLSANNKNSADVHAKIDWFHLGADLQQSNPSRGMPDSSGGILEQLKQIPAFLMVGTVEPRKGYLQVLDAFEQLWESGSDACLVIVGKQGWHTDKLARRIRKHAENGRRLYWLEGISDEYLDAVYSACDCLIAASYGEGFGLPLIEAAQHGLPIVARDIPVFREVAGDHAYYFDATTAQGLADALGDWLALYRERRHPDVAGMTWLTWQQSADRLAELVCT